MNRIIIVLMFLFAAQATFAQERSLARIFFFEPKQGQHAQFQEALQKHAQWRKQQGDPWTWWVHQVVNGANINHYIVRSGNHTWADMDSYSEFLMKGSIEFEKTVVPYIESMSSAITVVDTMNVIWPDNPDDVNLLAVTRYHIKPGKQPVFNQTISKVHKAIVEHNYPTHYAWEWTVNGDPVPSVALVLPYTNWTAMQQEGENIQQFIIRAMGADPGQQMMEDFSSCYSSAESMVIAVRRDLSVLP
jgi:hypothetical protein